MESVVRRATGHGRACYGGMGDPPDDEQIRATRERARRAAEVAAEAALLRCKRAAATGERRFQDIRAWWRLRRRVGSDRP